MLCYFLIAPVHFCRQSLLLRWNFRKSPTKLDAHWLDLETNNHRSAVAFLYTTHTQLLINLGFVFGSAAFLLLCSRLLISISRYYLLFPIFPSSGIRPHVSTAQYVREDRQNQQFQHTGIICTPREMLVL